jgi:hypothetical protein
MSDTNPSPVAKFVAALTGWKTRAETAEAQLAAALQTAKEHEGEIARLTADLSATKGKLIVAEQATTEAQAAVAASAERFAGFALALGLKPTEAAELTGEQAKEKLSARISAGVADQMASLGFAAAELPAATEGKPGSSKQELRDKYQLLLKTDSAAAAQFYSEHKAEMLD